jgi:hypothetical protein
MLNSFASTPRYNNDILFNVDSNQGYFKNLFLSICNDVNKLTSYNLVLTNFLVISISPKKIVNKFKIKHNFIILFIYF